MERTLYLSVCPPSHTHTHMWNSSLLPSVLLPAFSDYTNMGRKHNAQSRACQNSDAPGMLTWWCWISQLPLLPPGLNQLQFLSVQRSTIDEMWLPDLLFVQPLATSPWGSCQYCRSDRNCLVNTVCLHKQRAVSQFAWTLTATMKSSEGLRLSDSRCEPVICRYTIPSPTMHLHTQWLLHAQIS